MNMLDRPATFDSGRQPRMTAEARRTRLIAAAETMFLRKGYHATTMDDIAREAGMSKKTVYQVCTTKLALFQAFLEVQYATFAAPIEASGESPRAVLTAVLNRLLRAALDPRQVAVMRLMIAETPQSGDIVLALQQRWLEPRHSALQPWLEAQGALGNLRVDNVAQMAATLFFGTVSEPLFTQLLRVAPMPSDAQIEAQVERNVDMFLRIYGRN